MATEARFGWELPDLGDVADGPDAFLQFANGISDTVGLGVTTTYTPSWTSNGGLQPASPATRWGNYQILKKNCTFTMGLTFSSSTSGGSGDLYVGLPVPARSGINNQFAEALLGIPNVGYMRGYLEIGPGVTTGRPWFPANTSSNIHWPWRSAAIGVLTPDSGYPNPGDNVHNIRNGGSLLIHGTYLIA